MSKPISNKKQKMMPFLRMFKRLLVLQALQMNFEFAYKIQKIPNKSINGGSNLYGRIITDLFVDHDM